MHVLLSITLLTRCRSVVDTSYPQPNSPVADRAEIVSMEDRYPNAYKFADAMKAVDYKQLFKTRKGHFSTTSWGAQPDDILVALNGAPILHVIRKVTSATDHEPEVWVGLGDGTGGGKAADRMTSMRTRTQSAVAHSKSHAG